MKIFGIIIILLSGTAIGFKASDNLVVQNEMLKRLKKMVIILRGEIKYSNSHLGQALVNVSDKTGMPYSEFLMYVSEKLAECSGRAVCEIWKEGVEKKLSGSVLSKKQLNSIVELGDTLGGLDKDTQLSSFDLFIERLEEEIVDNNSRMKDNCKLYKYLGVMGSILVVLLIS